MLTRIGLPGVALALSVAVGIPGVRAAEAELLAQEPSGAVEVSEETRLVVADLVGEVSIFPGKPGALAFDSRTLDGDHGPAPVALWLDGPTFRIGRAPGADPRSPLSLTVHVPPELRVDVDASDSKVLAWGVRGSLQVRGTRLDVKVEASEGPVSLELEGGKVEVVRTPAEVHLGTHATDATLETVRGPLTLRTTGGRIEAREVSGIDGQSKGSRIKVEGVSGAVRLRAEGGTVGAKKLLLGGEFHMTGSPLAITGCKGPLEIESDSEVRFDDTDTVRITGSGASVFGSRNVGSLEVRVDDAAVTLGELAGTLAVYGSNLKLSLSHASTNSKLDVVSSEAEIVDVSGLLDVSSDTSNIKVSNASQEVTIHSRGGDVQVLEQVGPAQVQADGDQVLVEWGNPYLAKSCTIQNDGGSVSMIFRPGSGCRVEAETRNGRIESDLPELQVSADGTHAAGSLGRANQSAVVRVLAERDITLSSHKSEE